MLNIQQEYYEVSIHWKVEPSTPQLTKNYEERGGDTYNALVITFKRNSNRRIAEIDVLALVVKLYTRLLTRV